MRARSRTARSEKPGANPNRSSRRERQIVRIVALLRLLAQGRSPSVHELASEFRTRRETIYRDLRVLQDAGYPIRGDERGRLSRPKLLPSPIPAVSFSADEVKALVLAATQACPALPDESSLRAAILKLKTIGESASDAIPLGFERMLESWNSGSKDYRAHENWIAVLIEAILRKQRCRVEYRAPGRPTSKRYDFDPYRLLLVGGGLYVIGYVPKHANIVTLAVDRLESTVRSEISFEVDAMFDLARCREDAFGVSWNDPVDVVLRFRADQAPYVRERI